MQGQPNSSSSGQNQIFRYNTVANTQQQVPIPFPSQNTNQKSTFESYFSEIVKDLQNEGGDQETIIKTLTHIYEGSKQIKEVKEDIYIIMGITGAGKTTLAAYLSAIDLKVSGIKFGNEYETSLKYLSPESEQQYGKIGQSQVKSETLIPNIFETLEGKCQIVDCPGFQDSRGIEVDIANSFYLSKVISSAKRIKFILAIDGESFKNGLENKGESLKTTFEILMQMSYGTTINFAKNLIVVFTKTSKDKSYYSKYLKKIINDLKNSNDYPNKVQKFNEKIGFYSFLDQLSQSQTVIFPLPLVEDVNKKFSDSSRNDLLRQIEAIQPYNNDKRDIKIPFSINSLEKISAIRKYSRNKVSQIFEQLCSLLSKDFKQFDKEKLNQVKSLQDSLTSSMNNYDCETNVEYFQFLKENLISKLKLLSSNYLTTIENETYEILLKQFEFFMEHVYDKLLSKVSILQSDEIKFGIFDNEQQNGLGILLKNFELSLIEVEQNERSMELEQLSLLNDQQIKNIQNDIIQKQATQTQYDTQIASLNSELEAIRLEKIEIEKKHEEVRARQIEEQRNRQEAEQKSNELRIANEKKSRKDSIWGTIGVVGGIIGCVACSCSIF